MVWFLNKARGGDVIVIRNGAEGANPSSTADGYNPYFYSELGVKVDSVETIFLNSRQVANDPEVNQKIRNAEAVFFTGGDQSYYWLQIKGTALEVSFDYIINTRRIAIGGTSAGCAIMGEYLFSAELDSVTSTEALANPYNPKITIQKDLFKHQSLRDTITDQHYMNRDRRGRHVTFMARILTDNPTSVNKVRGIGVDEATAVCIEPSTGRAHVYGKGNGAAYFIQQYKTTEKPERCQANASLDWYLNRQALEAYRIVGTKLGDRYFDLKNWNSGSGGSWSFYYVNRGLFGIN